MVFGIVECVVNSTECVFSDWSSWSSCSESCGAGTEVRSRQLISPKLAIGMPGRGGCSAIHCEDLHHCVCTIRDGVLYFT